MSDHEHEEYIRRRTMIFAISANSQTAGLDVWEAKPDGFAERSRVYMRNTILVTDTTIGKIETLAGDVAIRVWSIISG